MSGVTTARARAEAWFQSKSREAADLVNTVRDEAERRVDSVVQRVLSTFQIVTTGEVAELDAKLKTIAKRIEQIEKKSKRAVATA